MAIDSLCRVKIRSLEKLKHKGSKHLFWFKVMYPFGIILRPHHLFFFALGTQLDPGVIPSVNTEGVFAVWASPVVIA
jgi:hypothetical protein